jgi:hypothetical protein
MKLQYRVFGEADDVREVPFGRLETYDMGEIRIGRSILASSRRPARSSSGMAAGVTFWPATISSCGNGSIGSEAGR